jgi:gamma-glutamylcyclotransferase (GGCT)/AIG2-like uncharacterized protein YtfP
MTDKFFAYGILKRGFELDLSQYGGKFVSTASVRGTLYHISSGVGLRLGGDKIAHGELWEIPRTLWGWLDKIEGVEYNVYARRLVQLIDGESSAYLYEHMGFTGDGPYLDWYYENRLTEIEGGVFV